MTTLTEARATDILANAAGIAPRLAALAAANDRSGEFPHASIQLLHEAGILTATVGTQFGGPGLRHRDQARLLRILGKADPAVALIASMTLALHLREASSPVLSPGFYEDILGESRHRPVLLNSLQVEPAMGTPSRGGVPATTARRSSDGGWVLTGHKIFSTGAPGLRWMLVLAVTDEDEPRVGTFIVDAEAAGIEIRSTWSAAGMRATRSDDVLFTDVFVPAERVIALAAPNPAPRGNDGPGTAIPSIYLGVADAARDWLITFLRSRVPSNLGHPLIELPRFTDALGEIELQLTVAGDLLDSLGARADAGESIGRTSAWAAKSYANQAAINAVQRAVSLIGNPGISIDNPLERHLRDVLCSRIHFPQDDLVVGALGRHAIGQVHETDSNLSTSVRTTDNRKDKESP